MPVGKMNPAKISATAWAIANSEELMREQGFVPSGAPQVWRENPHALAPRRVSLTGTFVMGLKSKRLKKKFTAKRVRDTIMNYFPVGGSVIAILGYWERAREDSVRVTIENLPEEKLTDIEFKKLFGQMTSDFSDEFGQDVVIVDYFKGSQRSGKPLIGIWHP